jgi:hypothetical protein
LAAPETLPDFHILPAPSSLSSEQPDFAQTVKQQANIVKVIEGYIRLRMAGAQNCTGLCPFQKFPRGAQR